MVYFCLNTYFESHFSSIGSQQQQQGNWDGRSDSPVVSADYDMKHPPVFNGYVHYRGEESTCGLSKLSTFNDQWEISFDITNAHDS